MSWKQERDAAVLDFYGYKYCQWRRIREDYDSITFERRKDRRRITLRY